jgi:hypothetical protein
MAVTESIRKCGQKGQSITPLYIRHLIEAAATPFPTVTL